MINWYIQENKRLKRELDAAHKAKRRANILAQKAEQGLTVMHVHNPGDALKGFITLALSVLASFVTGAVIW